MWRYVWIGAAICLASASFAWGQNALFSGKSGDKETPVEVSADQALEWRRDQKIYIARGNAEAKRGDLSILSETLTAYYRDGVNGGTQIWKLAADQNVRIVTPTQKAFGDKGIYNVDTQTMTLTGQNLRFEAALDTVTAQDSLEYHSIEKQAVARGNAVATRGQNRIKADILEAYFHNNAQGNLELTSIEAVGNVLITTPTDVLRGRKGHYDVLKQISTLEGDVKITRGNNQLNGEKAEVNLATGISRMLASSSISAPGGRVRGLFVPNQAPKMNEKPASNAPSTVVPQKP